MDIAASIGYIHDAATAGLKIVDHAKARRVTTKVKERAVMTRMCPRVKHRNNSVAIGCGAIMTAITAEDGVPGPLLHSRERTLARAANRWKETARVLRRAVEVVDAAVRHDVTSVVISAEEEVAVRHDVLAARMAR